MYIELVSADRCIWQLNSTILGMHIDLVSPGRCIWQPRSQIRARTACGASSDGEKARRYVKARESVATVAEHFCWQATTPFLPLDSWYSSVWFCIIVVGHSPASNRVGMNFSWWCGVLFYFPLFLAGKACLSSFRGVSAVDSVRSI